MLDNVAYYVGSFRLNGFQGWAERSVNYIL